MDPKVIVVAAVVFVALLLMSWFAARKRRTETLQRRFGTEYDRTVRELGSTHAESILAEREKRIDQLSLRQLSFEQCERFRTEWRLVQARFVDAPEQALVAADRMIDRLMIARGYPAADFDQRAADISVDHPVAVDHYRAARLIALRQRAGQASTEDLRRAVLYYRSLFDELLRNNFSIREVA
jgi:hypothetical protein